MRNYFSLILCCFLTIQSSCVNKRTDNDKTSDTIDDKAQLLQLEHQWLENEFTADTAFLSSIMDSTFICITPGGMLTKQETLKHMGDNKNFRTKNDIVIDSVALENAIVNIYGNSAVVTFIDHTYARKQGTPLETKVQFYDVWIKRDGQWKAVSSQAHY
jgi:hypothetical protein